MNNQMSFFSSLHHMQAYIPTNKPRLWLGHLPWHVQSAVHGSIMDHKEEVLSYLQHAETAARIEKCSGRLKKSTTDKHIFVVLLDIYALVGSTFLIRGLLHLIIFNTLTHSTRPDHVQPSYTQTHPAHPYIYGFNSRMIDEYRGLASLLSKLKHTCYKRTATQNVRSEV